MTDVLVYSIILYCYGEYRSYHGGLAFEAGP